MNSHTVTILQKNYNISCSQEEIPHIQECTDLVNNVLTQILKNRKTNSENTLMAMALLTIADELLEYKKKSNVTCSQPIAIELEQAVEYIIPKDMLSKLEGLYQKMHDNSSALPSP